MTSFVVDTNVLVVANGRRANADAECQLACVEKLATVVDRHTVAIDEQGAIVEEYANNASWAGGPGVGDVFF